MSRLLGCITAATVLGALLVDYLALSWFDLGQGDHITHGAGVLVWYGAPVLASCCALVALRDRRIALSLAAVCIMLGWLEFYWLATDHGVTLN